MHLWSCCYEISRKHGLSVIETNGSGEAYAEWQAQAQGKPTIRGMIRKDIDDALAQAFTLHSLLSILQKQGYTIKIGPKLRHTAIRPPGGTRFIRLDSLGEGYTEAEIIQRLKALRGGTPPKQTPAEKAPCEQIADTFPQLSLSAKQTDDPAKQNTPCPDHPKSFAR